MMTPFFGITDALAPEEIKDFELQHMGRGNREGYLLLESERLLS